MEDKEFIENIVERLEENRKTIEKIDEFTRVEVMFMQRFQPVLLDALGNCANDKFYFTRDLITDEPVDYNLLTLMDSNGTMASLAYRKGYEYNKLESTPNMLVFEKRTK